MTNNTFKSGFVAILGRPNVGKSTFLNHVMGQKIAIMSDKPQTTRNKIQGIYTTDKEQIIFIDTPVSINRIMRWAILWCSLPILRFVSVIWSFSWLLLTSRARRVKT